MKKFLFEAAEEVYKTLNSSLRKNFSEEVGLGADGTPTSKIDEIAESVIINKVEREDVPLNILSEEADFIDNGSDLTLVLDPVDGTFNALLGTPFYAISMAIGESCLSNVRYGLVKSLSNGDVCYAEKGKGAFQNGGRIRTAVFDPEKSLFIVYMGKLASPRSFEIASRARRARSYGAASLEMCMVASGQADLYYVECEAMLRIIDIAAGTLIVREAGGEVLDMEGKELEMKFDITERSNFMAVGDKRVLEVLR
ncbi:MAG: inositol monophosphatase family protein [Thermoplasmata archaeon]